MIEMDIKLRDVSGNPCFPWGSNINKSEYKKEFENIVLYGSVGNKPPELMVMLSAKENSNITVELNVIGTLFDALEIYVKESKTKEEMERRISCIMARMMICLERLSEFKGDMASAMMLNKLILSVILGRLDKDEII